MLKENKTLQHFIYVYLELFVMFIYTVAIIVQLQWYLTGEKKV